MLQRLNGERRKNRFCESNNKSAPPHVARRGSDRIEA